MKIEILYLGSSSITELKKRCGLIYIDINNDGSGTLERYMKKSLWWYKEVISLNRTNFKQGQVVG